MTMATLIIILHTIGAFLQQHWHKVIAIIAFFFAAYNKWQHNALFNKVAELINVEKPKPVAKSKKNRSHKKK